MKKINHLKSKLYDVTLATEDANRNQAHKGILRIPEIERNVTLASDDDQQSQAHNTTELAEDS